MLDSRITVVLGQIRTESTLVVSQELVVPTPLPPVSSLVCRPRSADDAQMSTRREFVDALRDELPDALRTMQAGKHRARRPRPSCHWTRAWPSSAATPASLTSAAARSQCATPSPSSTRRWKRRSPNKKATSTPTPAGPSPGSSSRASPKANSASPRPSPRPKTPAWTA